MDYLQYLKTGKFYKSEDEVSFKPYYKWITFNTYEQIYTIQGYNVLNLIINGLPSILEKKKALGKT